MKLNKILLRNTARAWGIQPSYLVNQVAQWSPERSILQVLCDLTKTPIESDEDLRALLKKRRQKYLEEGLEKSAVLWGGRPAPLFLYLPLGQEVPSLTATVTLEDGSKKSVPLKILNTTRRADHQRVKLHWEESLALGCHELAIQLGTKTFKTLLICAPEKLETAPKLQNSWGPFAPLYALRTGNEWGIGSLKELRLALEKCADSGAQWLGTLPLLAVNLDHEDCDPSPYSALTRLFWNEIFLDVEALVEKYNLPEARQLVASGEFQKKLAEVRASSHVKYHGVYKLKKSVLKILSNNFFATKMNLESPYQNFVKENSEIDSYAAFRSLNIEEQNFHRFVQFEMNESLRELSQSLPQGLYLDFPVGVNDAGFDFKEFNSIFFKEVSVGAPPEEVFQQGQDWGFPAFNPLSHRQEGYQYLRKSLKNHLKYCKILRMDHVMGLYRVFCVPKKWTAHDGIYLRYPKNDLFAIAMLEAHRAKADIVGENLGTVPSAVNEIICERNFNGMWVLQLEAGRDPDTAFESIPKNTMISFNNHDLPMWASFVKGTDLDLVHSLNILSEKSRVQFQDERQKQIQKWTEFAKTENLTVKLHESLAKSPGKYFVVTLEDLWGEESPQNIPGTWKEYPNWRRKFSKPISEWSETPQIQKIFSILKQSRS